jgi:hypothetical protein
MTSLSLVGSKDPRKKQEGIFFPYLYICRMKDLLFAQDQMDNFPLTQNSNQNQKNEQKSIITVRLKIEICLFCSLISYGDQAHNGQFTGQIRSTISLTTSYS